MKKNIKGQFIKGTNGNVYDGFGVWYDKKGYPTIYINGKDIKLHVYIWERKYGEKPKGFDIHHKDYNKKNYNLDNLELLNYSDHRKVHAGWIRKNGVWILKPCKICKQKLSLDCFSSRKGLTPSNVCKKCCSLINKERLKNDKEFREKKRLYLQKYYAENKIKILKQQKNRRQEVIQCVN